MCLTPTREVSDTKTGLAGLSRTSHPPRTTFRTSRPSSLVLALSLSPMRDLMSIRSSHRDTGAPEFDAADLPGEINDGFYRKLIALRAQKGIQRSPGNVLHREESAHAIWRLDDVGVEDAHDVRVADPAEPF